MSPSFSVRFLQTQSDARLLVLARDGHERAFEALVQRHRKALLNYCRRLLLPDARAEDALQQALLRAWIALRDGVEVRDAKPWLFRIVHNTALNMLRVSGYDYAQLSESLHGAQAPEADLDRRIAIREALAGLAALPEMQREALLGTAIEGRSHEQVAAALGVSDGAVRGLVYRARAALRAAATAITPPPIAAWAATAGGHAAPLSARIADLAAGGGSVGLAGALVKGGAAAVTAGALVAGIAVVPPRPPQSSHHSQTRATSASADPVPARALVAPDRVAARLGAADGSGAQQAGQRATNAGAPRDDAAGRLLRAPRSPDAGGGGDRHGGSGHDHGPAGERQGSALGTSDGAAPSTSPHGGTGGDTTPSTPSGDGHGASGHDHSGDTIPSGGDSHQTTPQIPATDSSAAPIPGD